MGKNLSYFLFILWLCYLIVSSILLFTRGFLLTRVVQNVNSTCTFFNDLPCSQVLNSTGLGCTKLEKQNSLLNDYSRAGNVCLPPQARVVLLIVDALRYDFTVYNEKLQEPLPFQNKLPVIHKIRNKNPNNSRLYKFIADPPTTTMQRLKALTTGSLPTFIDAGSNFATSEIEEDNLIDQLLRNNYNTIFMGDDTWDGLYPNRFLRHYPYPSFNVWDLDTVDNGVRENLFPELKHKDWNLLIGHFLGVDHCGHRYGPNHPEMERKLTEINDIIELVVEKLEDDILLFVIGDHGMTSTGDHGGESPDETNSAMFVYSKKPLLSLTNETETKQVNLIPTLSTILQVPIPFQNLGTLILDCLPTNILTKDLLTWKQILFYQWANVQQIFRYIEEYSLNTNTFNEVVLKEFRETYLILNAKIRTITSESQFLQFSKEATSFMVDVRDMCETVWVKFDSYSMTRGLLFLFLSVFFVYVITDGIPLKLIPQIFVTSFIIVSYAIMLIASIITCLLYYIDFVEDLSNAILCSTCVVSQFMLALLIVQNWEVISLNWYDRSQKEGIPNLVCRLVLVLNLCCLLSNSYIIEESFVLLFLLVTVILVGTIGISPSSTLESTYSKFHKTQKSDLFKSFKWSKLKLFLIALTIAGLVRTSMYFWRCRTEQQWCFGSPHEITNLTAKVETTKLQWGITVIFLAVFVIATKVWLSKCGNLNGYSITITLIKFLPTVIVVLTAGYWVLKRLPSKRPHNFKSANYLALSVYGLTLVGVTTLLLKPLCTYVMPSKNELTLQKNINVIPQLYRKIKGYFLEKKEKKLADNEDVPVICGLGTAYSAVFIILGIYWTLLFALLLGDAVAPSAVIMFMTAAFVLIITSVFRVDKAESIESLFDIPNMSVLIWIILSQYFFYASGHQPTFPNIPWDSAFVGTSGIFIHNFIPGTLIIINTFCSHILMGMMLPLVLITPFTVFVMIPSAIAKKKELHQAVQRGEVVLFERDDLTTTSAFTVCCKYISGHAVRVFASMLSATIHCRHLMVWNIFAPKLIFESIGMIVTLGSVTIGYLILLRINSKIEKLIIKLNKMS